MQASVARLNVLAAAVMVLLPAGTLVVLMFIWQQDEQRLRSSSAGGLTSTHLMQVAYEVLAAQQRLMLGAALDPSSDTTAMPGLQREFEDTLAALAARHPSEEGARLVAAVRERHAGLRVLADRMLAAEPALSLTTAHRLWRAQAERLAASMAELSRHALLDIRREMVEASAVTGVATAALIGALALATAVAVAVSVALRRGVVTPLSKLAAYAADAGGHDPMPPVEDVGGLLEVRQLNDALQDMVRRVNRLTADQEQFTRVASHDLKAPLRGIDHLVDWIAEDLGDEPPGKVGKNLRRLRSRVQSLDSLLDDLLAYTRAGRGGARLEPTDTAELVVQLAEQCALPEHVSIEIDEQLPTLRTSRVALETVLRNLILNAVDHRPRAPGTVTVTARRDGGQYRFAVEDDGPGVPEEHRDRIFTMFERLGREPGHSGVGLAIVKRIVETAGGRVYCTPPECGSGARFEFTWPIEWRRAAERKDAVA